MSPLLGTGLPYGFPTRRTGHNPPRGPSADWWVKYIHIIHKTPRPNTNSMSVCILYFSCTQMFALCGNRKRDLSRSRRVFPPLRRRPWTACLVYSRVDCIQTADELQFAVGLQLKRPTTT
jgi:hypothetical protein